MHYQKCPIPSTLFIFIKSRNYRKKFKDGILLYHAPYQEAQLTINEFKKCLFWEHLTPKVRTLTWSSR